MIAGEGQSVYEIRVNGILEERWSSWFEGLELIPESGGITCLKGRVRDQSALIAILYRIHGLNLELISLIRLGPQRFCIHSDCTT